MNRKNVYLITVLVWAIVTAVCALLYVRSQLALPGLEGYETEWRFQLAFFGLVRLPYFVIGLAVLLWLESRYLSSG